MLSGIQHFAFCRRQWALIHIEQQWQENEYTVEGELLHKNAHDPFFNEKRKDVKVSRSMPVFSRTMGISGECDIVEFRKSDDGISIHGDFIKSIQLSIRRAVLKIRKSTYCSLQRRPCAWRKCFRPTFRRELSFMGKHGADRLLSSQRNLKSR